MRDWRYASAFAYWLKGRRLHVRCDHTDGAIRVNVDADILKTAKCDMPVPDVLRKSRLSEATL